MDTLKFYFLSLLYMVAIVATISGMITYNFVNMLPLVVNSLMLGYVIATRPTFSIPTFTQIWNAITFKSTPAVVQNSFTVAPVAIPTTPVATAPLTLAQLLSTQNAQQSIN